MLTHLDKLSICQSKLCFLGLDGCKAFIHRPWRVLCDHLRQLCLQALQLLLSNLLFVVLHQLCKPLRLKMSTNCYDVDYEQ